VLSERVSLNAAVFRTEKTNARTPGINPGDPPTVLAGRQVVRGLELGVSGRLTRRWTGIVNYSFMRSDIAASNTSAEIDQSLQFTPESTFYLWTTVDVWRSLRVGGGVQYMDSVFRNAVNTTEVPSYWLTSGLLSYDINQHLTLRLNGQNLGNAVYVDRTSGGHYLPGPGRSLNVSTSVRF
jgi:catecholate siderophore receptor